MACMVIEPVLCTVNVCFAKDPKWMLIRLKSLKFTVQSCTPYVLVKYSSLWRWRRWASTHSRCLKWRWYLCWAWYLRQSSRVVFTSRHDLYVARWLFYLVELLSSKRPIFSQVKRACRYFKVSQFCRRASEIILPFSVGIHLTFGHWNRGESQLLIRVRHFASLHSKSVNLHIFWLVERWSSLSNI